MKRIQKVLDYSIFAIRRYRHFIETFYNQYSPNEPILALNVYKINKNVVSYSDWHYLYDILFEIVEFDHRLSYNRRRMKELILHYSRLEEVLSNNTIPQPLTLMVNAMKDKCFFLLRKLLIYDKSGVDYMVDFEMKHVGVEDNSPDWLRNMENAFEFYRKSDTSGERFGLQLEVWEYEEKLRLSYYPLLMKYYKDLKSANISKINQIIENFEKEYAVVDKFYSEWRVFDKYALKTIKCYLYNARFDFNLTSGHKYTFDTMLKDLQIIEDLQYETKVKDFYPFLKAASFVAELLENRSQCTPDQKKEYLRTLDTLLEKCSDALLICQSRSFYPIQCRYLDCLVMYKGFGPIFIPSSYCRPLRFELIEEKITKLKTRALYFENALRLDDERVEIESIKESIDQSRKQTIEIISAFTAIITFLFGTIDFFSKTEGESLVERIYNVLSLGLVLLLFVSSISVVTMRRELPWKDYWKEPRFLFFVVLSAIVLLLLGYLFFHPIPVIENLDKTRPFFSVLL